MHKGSVFRKDGFLTVTIVGLFCCLFLIIGLNQSETRNSNVVLNSKPVDNSASVITAKNQIRNNRTQALGIQSTSTIDTLQKTVVTDEQLEKKSVQQDQPSKKPTIREKEIPVVSSVEPVVREESDVSYIREITRRIEEKTNAFRVQEGLLTLSYDSTLEKNAVAYSSVMQNGNFLSHTNKSGCGLTCRFTNDGYKAVSWGENLAMIRFEVRPSAEEIATFFMTEWKKSAGHRENLLSPTFTLQGIGVALSPSSVYVTVHFAKP